MLRRFLSFAKADTIFLLFVIPIAALVSVSVSAVLQLITDTANGKSGLSYAMLVLVVLAYVVIDALVWSYRSYIRSKWLNNISAGVRDSLMTHYLSETETLAETDHGQKNTRLNQMTNNVDVLQNDYLAAAVNIYSELCQFFIAIVMSVFIQPVLCLIVIALCLPILLIPVFNQKVLKRSKNRVLASSEQYTQTMQNILNGLRTIQLFNVHRIMQRVFAKKNSAWLKDQNADQRNRKTISGISQLLDNVLYLGTWVGGIFFVMQGSLTLGELVGFSQLMVFISEPLQSASGLIADYVGGKEAAVKISDSLAANEPSAKGTAIDQLHTIAYENVAEEKSSKTILHDISLSLSAGKHYLIVGKTGSGKSTLLNLPLLSKTGYQGRVLINGVDQKKIDLASLRDHLGIAEQNGALFTGTIKDNVTMFRDQYTAAEITQALDQAQLSQYATPAGLAKKVTFSGQELSGGETKRLYIARALLGRFDFLLFDEPASGLDPKTASGIETMLMSLPCGWATITHRFNRQLFDYADEILVVDQGTIVARGQAQDPVIQDHLAGLKLAGA
ncbi:ATP-binding cassette domain-containing protein [Schleiferilactobacillus shenzhenensis]|uniref:ABC transporter ATP-binding protein n=1 Tax=Schleiferilactobacillus shenzhenensis LY-73 TaxID=1231336 RepID=U4TK08_9LACO|nr:ABC transporter ATP-binding protein [Schleiferilactobacillus shenzhenensis]ERL65181.1 hypothetical protein L248_2856 [Schleiferilactobacillus shenzhenensis LY-73]